MNTDTLLLGGAALLLLASSKPKTTPIPQDEAIRKAAEAQFGVIIALPVWSDASRKILQKASKMLPAKTAAQQQALYDLMKTLPPHEVEDFAALLIEELNRTQVDKQIGAANGLLAYLGFGGREEEVIAIFQESLGLDPSGQLTEETVRFLKEKTGHRIMAPILREFGLDPTKISGSTQLRPTLSVRMAPLSYVRNILS